MTDATNVLITAEKTNEELVKNISLGLGPEFHVVDAGRFVVVLHQKYGAATIYPHDNEEAAKKCASVLSEAFKKSGLNILVSAFALSETMVRPPVVIRSGPQMFTDILVSMVRSSSGSERLSTDQLANAIILASDLKKKVRRLDPHLMEMLKNAIIQVVGNTKMFAGGAQIDVEELVMPQFLLPALLLSAAENWTLPVVSQKGLGGFVVQMAYDESAVLMFRVTGLEVSSPLLFYLPVLDVLRKQKRGGEFILDHCVERFGNFITDNLSSQLETSLEVRIATSS